MKNGKYIYYGLFLLLSCFLSCGEMDDPHMEFVEGGEIIYAPKPDSAKAFAGNERIKISLFGLSPRVVSVKLLWNNNTDSLEVPIPEAGGKDPFDIYLTDMAEGLHSFEIITYNRIGNSSVKSYTTGNVYGENYISTLGGRVLESTNVINGTALITWYSANDKMIGTEITYTDNAGDEQEAFVPADATEILLEQFVSGNTINYRTLYLPEPTAIDTFYSEFQQSGEIIEVEALLDKALFARVELPGDDYLAHNNNQSSWVMEKAWDGIKDDHNVLWHAGRNGFPSSISFDLGGLYNLTRMRIWSRTHPDHLFNKGGVSDFEIYGRADAPPADGSWAGWTKILTGISNKPSGLPLGQTTEEDLAYMLAGEEFIFDDAAPVRYIRMKVNDVWGPDADNYWNVNELSFWGFYR